MRATFKGDPERGIPRNTDYHIVALPKHTLVAEGKCSGELNVDLDLGHYKVVFNKDDPNDPKRIAYRYYEEQFVGVDEKQYALLRGILPKHAKAMQTSEGPRWACKIGGCDFSGMTVYATVAHEAEHQGFNLEKPEDLKKYLAGKDPLAKPEPARPAAPAAALRA
jgi:hypothetical protein